ncbi:hypothetical protein BJY00DRAFT_143799 [Aspergillus carlsbadensis]|nr:hypothetical protein BJY00DRAFT_143799 [Aspergillus carlsbadensis]
MSFVKGHSSVLSHLQSSVFRVQTIVRLLTRLQTSKSGLQTVELSSVSQTPFHDSPWEPVAHHGRVGQTVESTPHQRVTQTRSRPESLLVGSRLLGSPPSYPRPEARMASDSSNTGVMADVSHGRAGSECRLRTELCCAADQDPSSPLTPLEPFYLITPSSTLYDSISAGRDKYVI